jgi:hypothetical protein
MTWFQQNRWLGTFLIVVGVCVLIAGYLLLSAKSAHQAALARFNDVAAEKNRLEGLDPFPNEASYKKLQVHVANYGVALDKFKEELKTRVLPTPRLAPNEFQSRLRQAMLATAEKARANRVRLPDNFALGFDEYTAALPTTTMAPLLGQQLSQIELLMNILLEARIDGVISFARMASSQEHGGPPGPTPTPAGGGKAPAVAATGPKVIERATVDVTFASLPGSARKVLNQISTANQQFYVIRILHVHNDKDKGPAREVTATGAAAAQPGAAKSPTGSALNFIVGNEHIETSARIEFIRFTF